MDIQRVHGALIFIQRVHGIGKKKTALQNKAVVYTIVFTQLDYGKNCVLPGREVGFPSFPRTEK